jgi:hypothetical protein
MSRRRALRRYNSRNADQGGDPAAFGALFFAGVQQHDGDHKQHHDRAGIDDDLHGGHKFRAQQKILAASEAITTISESALLMGWLCTSRLTAPATQIAPKKRNRIR